MDTYQGKLNRGHYTRRPTLEEIDFVIKKLGLRERQLEALWGIPMDTIKRIRYNGRNLPWKYSHWFFSVLYVYDGKGLDEVPDFIKKKTL